MDARYKRNKSRGKFQRNQYWQRMQNIERRQFPHQGWGRGNWPRPSHGGYPVQRIRPASDTVVAAEEARQLEEKRRAASLVINKLQTLTAEDKSKSMRQLLVDTVATSNDNVSSINVEKEKETKRIAHVKKVFQPSVTSPKSTKRVAHPPNCIKNVRQNKIKRKVFQGLLRKSVSELKNIIIKPSLNDSQALSQLMKATRVSFSETMRKLAELKLQNKLQSGRPQLLTELENLVDTDIAVDVCNMPIETIQALQDIFNLDFDANLNSHVVEGSGTNQISKYEMEDSDPYGMDNSTDDDEELGPAPNERNFDLINTDSTLPLSNQQLVDSKIRVVEDLSLVNRLLVSDDHVQRHVSKLPDSTKSSQQTLYGPVNVEHFEANNGSSYCERTNLCSSLLNTSSPESPKHPSSKETNVDLNRSAINTLEKNKDELIATSNGTHPNCLIPDSVSTLTNPACITKEEVDLDGKERSTVIVAPQNVNDNPTPMNKPKPTGTTCDTVEPSRVSTQQGNRLILKDPFLGVSSEKLLENSAKQIAINVPASVLNDAQCPLHDLSSYTQAPMYHATHPMNVEQPAAAACQNVKSSGNGEQQGCRPAPETPCQNLPLGKTLGSSIKQFEAPAVTEDLVSSVQRPNFQKFTSSTKINKPTSASGEKVKSLVGNEPQIKAIVLEDTLHNMLYEKMLETVAKRITLNVPTTALNEVQSPSQDSLHSTPNLQLSKNDCFPEHSGTICEKIKSSKVDKHTPETQTIPPAKMLDCHVKLVALNISSNDLNRALKSNEKVPEISTGLVSPQTTSPIGVPLNQKNSAEPLDLNHNANQMSLTKETSCEQVVSSNTLRTDHFPAKKRKHLPDNPGSGPSAKKQKKGKKNRFESSFNSCENSSNPSSMQSPKNKQNKVIDPWRSNRKKSKKKKNRPNGFSYNNATNDTVLQNRNNQSAISRLKSVCDAEIQTDDLSVFTTFTKESCSQTEGGYSFMKIEDRGSETCGPIVQDNLQSCSGGSNPDSTYDDRLAEDFAGFLDDVKKLNYSCPRRQRIASQMVSMMSITFHSFRSMFNQ